MNFKKNMKKFVVYLTTYLGTMLPTKYIGSTTEEKILSGNYFGSIKSKRWKEIFKDELKNNKKLFGVEILSYHETRKEALEEELRLQVLYNVVKSSEYFNESLACPNGFFGRDVSGNLAPMFGKSRLKIWTKKYGIEKANELNKQLYAERKNNNINNPNLICTEEKRRKISNSNKGVKKPIGFGEKISKVLVGKILTQKHRENVSKSLIGNTNRKNIKASEITKKKMSESMLGKNTECDFLITKEFLEDLYFIKKLSRMMISYEIGCSISTVQRYLKKYNIIKK